MLARIDGFQRSIADVVAQRMGQRPDDEVPSMIAAVALTAVRSGLERWSRAVPGSATDDSPIPYVERALDLLHALSAD
jgi:hypothetical protein